jgi:predicted RNA-binding Zn-ribbon protein involved in translation (DUF1610 family)
MGPVKAILKGDAIYEAKSGKLIKSCLSSKKEIEDYAAHHYIALPVVDKAGRQWHFEGNPVYCRRAIKYELLNDDPVLLVRCPDCGGMGIRMDEPTVESDCIHCTQCGHEFDTRLEMMES